MLSIIISAVGTASFLSSSASAAVTPDSCFEVYVSGDNTATINKYYDNEDNNSSNPACPRDVEIPSQIGGAAVTEIYSEAFKGKGLTSVVMPDSITNIGMDSFYGNKITSVNIPTSIASIGTAAFSGNKLTQVTLPDSVTYIGGEAFAYNNITSVVFPKNITQIGSGVFQNNNIMSIIIPESVKYIGYAAFSGNLLTSVNIPGTVKVIDMRAFYGNRLQSVTLNEGTEYIGGEAFGFNQLTTVKIPVSVKALGGYFEEYDDTGAVVFAETDWQDAFYGQSDYDYAGFTVQNVELDDTDCSSYNDIDELFYGGGGQTAKQLCEGFTSANFWYTRLELADAANTNNFVDFSYAASRIFDGSYVFGGQLISAAQAQYNFTNTNGNKLADSVTQTGVLSDGTILTDYMVANGPEIPIPANPNSPTTEETAAIQAALKAYYRVGDQVNYTASTINGLNPTPASYSFALSANANDNVKTFVYGEEDGTSDEESNGETITQSSGSLADTGMSGLAASIAAVVLIAAAWTMVKIRQIKEMRR